MKLKIIGIITLSPYPDFYRHHDAPEESPDNDADNGADNDADNDADNASSLSGFFIGFFIGFLPHLSTPSPHTASSRRFNTRHP